MPSYMTANSSDPTRKSQIDSVLLKLPGDDVKVDDVIEYKRGNKTYYQAEVDERGGNRTFFYTVDAQGNEVEGLPRL